MYSLVKSQGLTTFLLLGLNVQSLSIISISPLFIVGFFTTGLWNATNEKSKLLSRPQKHFGRDMKWTLRCEFF